MSKIEKRSVWTFTKAIEGTVDARDLTWKEIVALLTHNIGQVALAIREDTAQRRESPSCASTGE